MLQPQAHSVLWFLAGFLGLWALSLIVRGVLHRSRTGVPTCPGCEAAIPAAEEGRPPRTVCPACRYEAKSRREFWPRSVHWAAVGAGVVLLVVAAGVGVLGYVEAAAVGRGRPETLLDGASFGVVLGVLSLMAWALWGSAPRGRKRCPKCWYDMGAVAASGRLVCPECGHDAGSNRNLLRRRRRTGLAVALAPLVLLGLLLPRIWLAVNEGPLGLVPTPVMIVGMWWLPESWIDPPATRGAFYSQTLVMRLSDRREMAEWERAWALRRVRAQIQDPSSPRTLRRAVELSVNDPDLAGAAAAIAEVIFSIADSKDPDHRAIRVMFSAQLWRLPQDAQGAVREVVFRRLPELKSLLERDDPEANNFAWLARPLGPDAAPLVPVFESAALRDAGMATGLGRQRALQLLWLLSTECPEAEAAVGRTLSSSAPRLTLDSLTVGLYQGTTPAVLAKVAVLTESDDPAIAALAITRAMREDAWAAEHLARITALAGTPGPRRAGAVRGLAMTNRLDGRELAEMLEDAAKDPDRRVRLAVVETCSALGLSGPENRELLRSLAKDADEGVAKAAHALESMLAR